MKIKEPICNICQNCHEIVGTCETCGTSFCLVCRGEIGKELCIYCYENNRDDAWDDYLDELVQESAERGYDGTETLVEYD